MSVISWSSSSTISFLKLVEVPCVSLPSYESISIDCLSDNKASSCFASEFSPTRLRLEVCFGEFPPVTSSETAAFAFFRSDVGCEGLMLLSDVVSLGR